MYIYLLATEIVCLSDSVFPAKADQRSLGNLNCYCKSTKAVMLHCCLKQDWTVSVD